MSLLSFLLYFGMVVVWIILSWLINRGLEKSIRLSLRVIISLMVSGVIVILFWALFFFD